MTAKKSTSKNVKVTSHLTMGEATTALQAQGYVRLGSGKFGSTWAHPNKKHIVKFFEDHAYLSYIISVLASGTRNKALPCASRLTEYRTSWGRRFFSVQLGRLTEGAKYMNDFGYIDATNFTRTIDGRTLGFIDTTKVFTAYVQTLTFHPRIQKFVPSVYAGLAKKVLTPTERKAARMVAKMAVRTVEELGDLGLDMHPGNFMLSGDTLVVTDPFCGLQRG